ncbi:alpha/beta hydrolase [Jatrophihabitans sp. YIM 134969]
MLVDRTWWGGAAVLDDVVRRFLDTKPDAGLETDPVERRRALILAASDELFETFGAPGPAVAAVEEHVVPHAGRRTRVRVYRPDTEPGHPVHVFLHGGGWWLGSVDELVVDATCRERAVGASCVVVSVQYSYAPEEVFPAAVEDAHAALQWAATHASSLGGDASALSIGGVSAGANLAAAVALLCRDQGGPALRLQVLEVPPLDLTLDTMRSSGVSDDYGITLAEMEWCTALYLGTPERARDPLASPLLADDLTGLPPAAVLTAEHDPLRDDGTRFAARLSAAGVPVTHVQQAGAVHGSLALTGTWSPARTWQDTVIDALRNVRVRADHTVDSGTGSPGHR